METLGNNGNQLAEMMHNAGILVNGITLERAEQLARLDGIITEGMRFVRYDDFWEDFSYRAEELGYSLNH
jgi:hypothetical protein